MPELPEVETVRRGLAPVLEGRRLRRIDVRRPDLRFPLPAGFAGRLIGRRILSVDRRAKYLLLRLDDDRVLVIHLGMSGRIKIHRDTAPPPDPHDHVVFETNDGTEIVFWDQRRFGFMLLLDVDELADHPLFRRLGPEPLANDFDGPRLAERLAGRRTSIKAALLDQHVVAGIGNIYACESLFRAGLSPRRRAGTIKGRRADRLATAVRDVLGEAIAAGGSTLRDHRLPTGELGYFQLLLGVYGRAGEPCPGCTCDTLATGGIRRIVQGGRSTFYCPQRQR